MKHPASDEPTIDIVLEKSLIHQTLLLEAQNPGIDQDLFHSFTVLFLLVWLWYLAFFRLFDSCVQHMADIEKTCKKLVVVRDFLCVDLLLDGWSI